MGADHGVGHSTDSRGIVGEIARICRDQQLVSLFETLKQVFDKMKVDGGCAMTGWRWLSIFLLLPLVGHAEPCGAAMTQAAMNECANDAFVKADAASNATFGQVISRLRTNHTIAQRLVAAQQAWIAFRDGECQFEASLTEGSSIHPMIVMQCREGVTRERTVELRRFLRCEEGDLRCPGACKVRLPQTVHTCGQRHAYIEIEAKIGKYMRRTCPPPFTFRQCEIVSRDLLRTLGPNEPTTNMTVSILISEHWACSYL